MILNLANKAKSDIRYDLINFPDGHKHVNLDFTGLGAFSNLIIKIRLLTYDDVFLLKQAVQQIRSKDPKATISLYITYFLASRYDRQMRTYDSFDLKIVADDINSLNFYHVTVLEPHSNVIPTLVNNIQVVHPLDETLFEFIHTLRNLDDVCFVIPDLGAVKRVEAFLIDRKLDIPIVYSNKHRILSTGEITGIDIFNPDLLKGTVIVYDDLCDGGFTFIKLAEKLRSIKSKYPIDTDQVNYLVESIHLFVTHGLFSKGLDCLLKANFELHYQGSFVDTIHTTNSYKEQETYPGLTVKEVI